MAAYYGDLETLRSTCVDLDKIIRKRNIAETTLIKLKAYIKLFEGYLAGAIDYAEKNLRRIPKEARDSFIEKLNAKKV